jgi:hypothetical protein
LAEQEVRHIRGVNDNQEDLEIVADYNETYRSGNEAQ